jgi:hypothetical protein
MNERMNGSSASMLYICAIDSIVKCTKNDLTVLNFVIVSDRMLVLISGSDCSHLLWVFLLWFTRLERWLGSLWTPTPSPEGPVHEQLPISQAISLPIPLWGPHRAQKECTSQPYTPDIRVLHVTGFSSSVHSDITLLSSFRFLVLCFWMSISYLSILPFSIS